MRAGVKMSQNVEMSAAGSLTIAGLFIAVVFLFRSFYKRYNRAAKSEDLKTFGDLGEDEKK